MDKEKVIKELHDARRYLEDKEWSDRDASPHIDALNDALALLKKQEAVEPTLIREGWNKYYNDYVCSRCGNEVVYEQNYCSECGVKFIWKGR